MRGCLFWARWKVAVVVIVLMPIAVSLPCMWLVFVSIGTLVGLAVGFVLFLVYHVFCVVSRGLLGWVLLGLFLWLWKC